MPEFRYQDAACTFDEELSTELAEIARETAVKEAEVSEKDKSPHHRGLDNLVHKKTPLEEVKAILEAKKRPPGQLIKEASVRAEMRKRASHNRASVDEFLSLAKA